MTTTRRLFQAAVLASAAILLGGSPPGAAAPPPPVLVVTAVHLTFVPGDTGPMAVPARMQQGGQAFFANADPDAPHTFSSEEAPDGSYQFTTNGHVDMGGVEEIHGVSALAVGTYRFVCQIHPDRMWGTLIVEPAS